MIDINLCDRSFAHLSSEDGIYSMTDNKKPKYTRYVKVDSGWEGVTFYTDAHLMSSEYLKHPGTNIGFLIETRETNPSIYNDVEKYIDNYDFLLTYDKELLDEYPDKTKFYPFGGCWVKPENYGFPLKSELVSMIYSPKTQTSGHRLRHSIANIGGIDLWGAGAGKPFDTKEEALSPYRFSIVIENTQNPYYFSEKLLDCMALGTIPLYYGATDIGSFFNEKGILTFTDLESLEGVLKSLSPELYAELLPYAEENQKLVRKYDTQEDWIFEHILLKNGLVKQNITEDLDVNDIRTYVEGDRQQKHLTSFLLAGGDDQLSNFSHLTEESVVWDIGSYVGEYSKEIYEKYKSQCYGFEPVKDLYNRSLKHSSEKIKFFNYGLGSGEGSFSISVLEDGSSFLLEGGDKEECEVRDIAKVFAELQTEHIDLMQMNVEGSEFDILERLIDSGLSEKINTFLIQFHYYGEFPVFRRDKILEKLADTHDMKFSYPFVWECWSKK